MKDHRDSGRRVRRHARGGQCIQCTCGVTVRPREWQAHVDAAEKEDARLKRMEQRYEAEWTMIEIAKVWRKLVYEYDRAIRDSFPEERQLADAIDKLNELEEEI